MHFSAEAQTEITSLYQRRSHVELTIGILKNGQTELVHLGPDQKEDHETGLVYPVGSICKLFVGTLFAKYIEAGKLDQDAPIDRNAGAFSAYLGLNREEKTAVAVGTNYGLVNAKQIGFAVLRGL